VNSTLNLKSQNSLEKEESKILYLYLNNTKNMKTTKTEGVPTGFEERDHQQLKETHEPNVWFPTQIPHRNASKTFPRKSTKKTPKITKKENKIHKQITRGLKDEFQTLHTRGGKIVYKEASYLSASYPLEDLPWSTLREKLPLVTGVDRLW
jgi:hypothetical protein